MVNRIKFLSFPTKLVRYLRDMECAYTASAFPPLSPTDINRCSLFSHCDVLTWSPEAKVLIETKSTKAASPDPAELRGVYQYENSALDKNAIYWNITPLFLERLVKTSTLAWSLHTRPSK
jgi:hypothetical protein